MQGLDPDRQQVKQVAPQTPDAAAKSTRLAGLGRYALAVAVVLTVAVYVSGVVIGQLTPSQRLGASELALIMAATVVVYALCRPEFIGRLTDIKFGGIELKLRELHQAQAAQRNELDDLRLVLTLLLQSAEATHPKNLAQGTTQNYVGHRDLRVELRRLRALGLIRSHYGRKIADIADKSKVDLKEFVELTERGRHYLDRLGKDDEPLDT